MALVGVVRVSFCVAGNYGLYSSCSSVRRERWRNHLPVTCFPMRWRPPFRERALRSSITTLTSLDFLWFRFTLGSPSLGELLLRKTISAPCQHRRIPLRGGAPFPLIFIGAVRDALIPTRRYDMTRPLLEHREPVDCVFKTGRITHGVTDLSLLQIQRRDAGAGRGTGPVRAFRRCWCCACSLPRWSAIRRGIFCSMDNRC